MSKDNVVRFTGITRLDLPADQILDRAKEANMDDCIIIGTDENGEFFFASNKADGGTVLWWLEMAKTRLFELAYDEEDR